MTETEIKLWTALVAAFASLIVALITHISGRSNQRAIEQFRDELGEKSAERHARRDYQYEARKRLYQECGPTLFQLAEFAEAAYYRVTGLAQTAKQGNLEPGRNSFLRDDYYRTSTLYRILAPSAALKLIQRRLTLVDLSLDRTIHRQYTLARQAFFAFGDEFMFASLSEPALRYEPFNDKAELKARSEPAVYSRQGLPLGVMEGAIEALLAPAEGHDQHVMTYAECESQYNKEGTKLREAFDDISFLIDDFHPRSRPVFWRMLVTQACLYRVLFRPRELDRASFGIDALSIPEPERTEFDWRSQSDLHVDPNAALQPLSVAEKYLRKRLAPRLERIDAADDKLDEAT
jgi:hypothetical protein